VKPPHWRCLLFVIFLSIHFFRPSWGADLRISGKIEAFIAGYLENKKGAEDALGGIRIKPRFILSGANDFLLYVEGDFRLDSAGFARGYMDDFLDRESRRKIFGIRETYVEYNKKWLRIRAGKQIYDWSVTDTASPNDNINPRDFIDIIQWERLGVPSLNARIGYDTFAEFVYVPWFTPSKLPIPDSRWDQTFPPGIARGDSDLPRRGNGQFAARVGTTHKGFDLGMSFYKGFTYSPSVRLDLASTSSFQLTPFYNKEEVYAISVAKGLWGYNFRGEIGYFDQKEGDKFVQYVAGVDREWAEVFHQADSLYILLQYVNEIKTFSSHSIGSEFPDFRRIFNDCIMGRFTYAFDPRKRWDIRIRGIYNLHDHDWLIEPAITWRKGGFEIEAGVNIMGGPSGSFWGGHKENDRIYLKLTFSY
jgi:hypothetical protein